MPCGVDRGTFDNVSTPLTGLLGELHELTHAKYLKLWLARTQCSQVSPITIMWQVCMALSCSPVYKLYGISYLKLLAFIPSTNTCLGISSYVNKGSLSGFSALGCCQAGLRNDKNESRCLPLIRLEGETPLPRMPHTERQELVQEEGQWNQWGSGHFRVGVGLTDACTGGKALKRAGPVIQMGHMLSLCTQNHAHHSGVHPVACGLHAAQDGCGCGSTQNCKST